jgi:hypothetical protein
MKATFELAALRLYSQGESRSLLSKFDYPERKPHLFMTIICSFFGDQIALLRAKIWPQYEQAFMITSQIEENPLKSSDRPWQD